MRKIRIIIAVIFFLFFIVANFYAIRALTLYGTELYLYDKLLVAFQFAGDDGLKRELANVLSQDKIRHELIIARKFESNLANIKNPGEFLADAVRDRKQKLNFFRNLRTVSLIIIFGLFLLRVAVNRCVKPGDN